MAAFLSHQLMLKSDSVPPNELILAGGFNDIIESWSSTGRDIQLLMAFHEEADTRLVLHAFDAKDSGFLNTIVNSRDMDVLVMHYCHGIDLLSVRRNSSNINLQNMTSHQ